MLSPATCLFSSQRKLELLLIAPLSALGITVPLTLQAQADEVIE